MSNVIEIQSNEHIKLDESRTKGMPENLKGHLIAVISYKARKHKCHWSEIVWSVDMVAGQPIIKVKHGE